MKAVLIALVALMGATSTASADAWCGASVTGYGFTCTRISYAFPDEETYQRYARAEARAEERAWRKERAREQAAMKAEARRIKRIIDDVTSE